MFQQGDGAARLNHPAESLQRLSAGDGMEQKTSVAKSSIESIIRKGQTLQHRMHEVDSLGPNFRSRDFEHTAQFACNA